MSLNLTKADMSLILLQCLDFIVCFPRVNGNFCSTRSAKDIYPQDKEGKGGEWSIDAGWICNAELSRRMALHIR
jgi:hypothetical protein